MREVFTEVKREEIRRWVILNKTFSRRNRKPSQILSGPITRSKIKQLKEELNELFQELNHDQRVP